MIFAVVVVLVVVVGMRYFEKYKCKNFIFSCTITIAYLYLLYNRNKIYKYKLGGAGEWQSRGVLKSRHIF